MAKSLKRFLNNQKGQALPMVLCVLAIGSLTIAASLNYSTTSLKGSRIIRQNLDGIYAAGAGIEHTLWSLKNGANPLAQLPEQINQMTVNITTVDSGNYTLYLGVMIEPGEHFGYLGITSNISWDAGAGKYKYIITITLQTTATIHLEEVGVRLPAGYSYDNVSASSFPSNFSTDEPQKTYSNGVWLLRWTLSPPPPLPKVSSSNPVITQTFYITGSGNLEGNYAWVVAAREDVGAVGEITGTLYKITATARRPSDNRTTAQIIADTVIQNDGIDRIVYIASWQVR